MNDSPKIQRILFATDFFESSRLALDYAVAMAHHFKAPLRMLHVVELSAPAMEAEAATSRPSLTRRAAMERLEGLASKVRRAGVAVETVVKDGIPADEIIKSASDRSCSLLVIGVHGVHRGVSHLIIGSNTEKILLSAVCPTLTVGANVMAGIDLNLRLTEILYFADFTPESAAAAPYATYLGKEFDVPVHVCQLISSGMQNGNNGTQRAAELYCETLLDTPGDTNPMWEHPAYQLERGMELEGLLKRVEREHSGLIVLGVRTPSALDRHLHMSFAYRLVAEATCPVLSIVKSPKPAAETVPGP